MGNLQEALKRNKHLENQNKGLLDALKRKNGQLEDYKAQSAQALAEISDLTASYIGAVCLNTDTKELKISHEDIKRVLAEFDVSVELGGDGITFKLVEKKRE
jgi:hypothetical protein